MSVTLVISGYERDIVVEALDMAYEDACEDANEGRAELIADLIERLRAAVTA